MRSRHLPGLPVLTLDSGMQLGKVKRGVIDPKQKRVTALVVSGPGWNRRNVLPIGAVAALGSHAVTVNGGTALIPIEEAVEYEPWMRTERVNVIGTPVVTVGGELAGVARDYEISGSGMIVAVYAALGFWKSALGGASAIPGELIVALGKDAVLVADQALALVLGNKVNKESPEASGSNFRESETGSTQSTR